MESKDGIIKFEIYRHYKNFKNYRVIGFVAMQTEKGEWVDSVLYISVTPLYGEGMLVRSVTDFKKKFTPVNSNKAKTIKTAIVEQRDPVSRNKFDNITNMVEKYFLANYPELKDITLDGTLLRAITTTEYTFYPEQWFDSKYMLILEDAGDTGIPGLNCISTASLISIYKLEDNKVGINKVFEIDVSGYGLEFAIDTIMNSYNKLLEHDRNAVHTTVVKDDKEKR